MLNLLLGVIYKSTVLIPESSFYNKFVIGKKLCQSANEFYKFKYVGSSKYILRVVNKYGIDKIKTEIVYMMFDNDVQNKQEKHKQLSEWEKHFIKLYDSQNPKIGMNITEGGNGGDTYSFVSEENKKIRSKKISDKLKNRIFSEEWKKKLVSNHISKKDNAKAKKWKENVGLCNKGRKHSEEQNLNCSKKLTGRKQLPTTVEKRMKTMKEKFGGHWAPRKGKVTPEITRKKQSKAMLGKKRGPQSRLHKQHLSASLKKRIFKNICKKCGIEFLCRSNRGYFCDNCKIKKVQKCQ
jgi:hypothetical protein